MSVRLAVRAMTERWERTGKLGRDERVARRNLAGLARAHSSAAFFGCDTVLEAGTLSALLEIRRKQEEFHVDP